MEFEWDDGKAALNLARHGIDFADAAWVFLDEHRVETEDTRDYGERRYKTIGAVSANVLVVVFTVRGEAIRLISARLAKPRERRQYHENQA